MIENFQVIAHRGASRYAPENTMAAFCKAHELGCFYIECDIAFSKDGVPFIFHDNYLNRTTNGKGKVSQLTWQQINSLDAGSWFSPDYAGEKLVSLKQLLDWHQKTGKMINLEIKPIKTALLNEYLDVILNEVGRVTHSQGLIFSSFQAEILKRLHVIGQAVPYALLATRWHKKHVMVASEAGCSQLNVAQHSLSHSAVAFTHEQGLKVGAYTVNEVLRAQQLKEHGVDAIFTDDIPLIKKGLQAP